MEIEKFLSEHLTREELDTLLWNFLYIIDGIKNCCGCKSEGKTKSIEIQENLASKLLGEKFETLRNAEKD